jgi:hypothetical protein
MMCFEALQARKTWARLETLAGEFTSGYIIEYLWLQCDAIPASSSKIKYIH